MAKSLTKGGKIMQGISRADKTIDTIKLANRVNKLRKPIKAVNYLDKATVAALGVKGLGNIAKGNIATGALQTGFGLLGMRGAADDARILKNLGAFSHLIALTSCLTPFLSVRLLRDKITSSRSLSYSGPEALLYAPAKPFGLI